MFVPGRKPTDLIPAAPSRPRCALTRLAAAHVVSVATDQRRLKQTQQQFATSGFTDYWFDADARRCGPDTVMPTLRFGGQFVFVSRSSREAKAVMQRYAARPEFVIERSLGPLPCGRLAKALGHAPLMFIARKVLLDRPENLVNRQSFDVRLVQDRRDARWVVRKSVPTLDQTLGRLYQVMPGRDPEHIDRLARKLVETVFPILLTRETGFLSLLQERLLEAMRGCVPEALRVERDEHGMVRLLDMTWLREGGDTIPPTMFAQQAADLLDAVHTRGRIVHLDLRLDNMVVTPRGVGFVDFGSACLVNEPIEDKRVIGSLFSSMLSASRIRRDLRRLRRKRLVTSTLFDRCYPKRNPAIDLFSLALQMTRPCANPMFKGLVQEDQDDRLTRLQRHVLRPRDPSRPYLTTPGQIAAVLSGKPLPLSKDTSHDTPGETMVLTAEQMSVVA